MKSIIIIFFLPIAVEMLFWQKKLKLMQEWKVLDYKFPNETVRQLAIESGEFIPGVPFAIDIDVQYKRGGETRYFVTTPRFGGGRPASLGTIIGIGTPEAVIDPYPDYSWHENQRNNCNGITSVLRVAIDQCSRLWVLDGGKINGEQICPPQLLAFDLNTDEVILKHLFTNAFIPASALITPIVDIRDEKCQDTFVYIADASGHALMVYDLTTNKSWRVKDQYTYPHPPFGTYTISGVSFTIMDGAFALALSPFKNKDDDRTLYFHALASNTENIIKTSSLRNSTLWSDNNFHPKEFKELSGRRPSQAASQAIDKDGIMYFGLIGKNALACWNTATPFSKWNIHILVRDDKTLEFASGVKIVNNLNGEQELWLTTSPLQKIWTGTRNNDEINNRILSANVKDLVRGSRCASRRFF